MEKSTGGGVHYKKNIIAKDKQRWKRMFDQYLKRLVGGGTEQKEPARYWAQSTADGEMHIFTRYNYFPLRDRVSSLYLSITLLSGPKALKPTSKLYWRTLFVTSLHCFKEEIATVLITVFSFLSYSCLFFHFFTKAAYFSG